MMLEDRNKVSSADCDINKSHVLAFRLRRTSHTGGRKRDVRFSDGQTLNHFNGGLATDGAEFLNRFTVYSATHDFRKRIVTHNTLEKVCANSVDRNKS